MTRLVIGLFIVSTFGCQSQQVKNEKRNIQSLPDSGEVTSAVGSDDGVVSEVGIDSCFEGENSNFASNKRMTINGKIYPADTHFTIQQTEDGFQVLAHLENESGNEVDDEGTYDVLDMSSSISCKNFTSIPIEENEDGETVLGEYSLPIDFEFVAKGKKRRRRRRRRKKSGVTYCYREVKRVVRHKIKLTGVAAYMANAQLKRAKWRRYSSYKRSPRGSICVFGKGGRETRSGGHKYGHIGIKGRGGVINPRSGFKLGRPFLGCYTKR